MSRNKRRARQRRAERRQKRRAEQALQARRRSVLQQRDIQRALARPVRRLHTILESLDENPDTSNWPEAKRSLIEHVHDRAPRLLAGAYYPALCAMAKCGQWRRPIAAWRPAAHGSHRQFVHLCEYLYAEFPLPRWLWRVWMDPNHESLAPFVVRLARGESLHRLCRQGRLTVPLTRAQAHRFLQLKDAPSVTHALRAIQVESAGGSFALRDAWLKSWMGSRILSSSGERFWGSVLQWFARQRVTDWAELSDWLEYIEHRSDADPEFTMKGRSLTALQRQCRAWKERAAQDAKAECAFERSGLVASDFALAQSIPGGLILEEVWKFRELLSSRELLREGRKMRNCVASYAPLVKRGACSLWSLSVEDLGGERRALTIQVASEQRKVIQVRGKFNRLPTAHECAIVRRWATENRLADGFS